ncbi:MAG: hypothetical protein KJ930_17565 [Gammaproteobacteria bacterium]|jgi:hypothetical protein|nr:hypothetical protein [Gammaproteobacteria bacterium]MBU2181234.1 hypothetical protein [Gammaproteobacteria bacterium]MBU2225683.1 hypothetical protein [Gammaproteobacteria bacterium]MBU2426062.1 hypothetical protein [Gammaproteobacteria bacterium]
MQEHQRLQKIRDIGIRLQELQLVSRRGDCSYAVLALNYLFGVYQIAKPQGLPLAEMLQHLADAVMTRHQLPYRRLTADSVLDFFSQRYQVAAPFSVHPSYRRRVRVTSLQQTM